MKKKKQKGEPKLGVKKKPWWPFIPVSHFMVPLLHCEIGIGNQLVDMLQDIINEHLENMTRTEERMQASIPVRWKVTKRIVALCSLLAASEDSANNDPSHQPLLLTPRQKKTI
jgi:hypothetical protein